MRKLFSLAAVAVIGTLLTLILIPESRTAPALSPIDLQGRPVSDADLRGKVSFINFWFPSCPSCVSEMPRVIKIAKDYRDRDFQVLDIAQLIDPPESVNRYVREYDLPSTVMLDGNKAVAQAFSTQVYPTSFLISKEGEILKAFVGEPGFAALYQEIDKRLAKQSKRSSETRFQTAPQTNTDTVVHHP